MSQQDVVDDDGYRPRWPSEVKQLAYTLDPECWISYSGKPRPFKARMDSRRTASLHEAERKIASGKFNAEPQTSTVHGNQGSLAF